ncbi:hypothetical protein C8Q76DRAFT_802542 [Earliella scabrosa]|nr:hypothetical protein C8Q76DRAFT_804462 [Earliella scabrosa]KAI0702252.1 hypothetical protein C8Q76DRAFT_802542 [Earliella scabrosa]
MPTNKKASVQSVVDKAEIERRENHNDIDDSQDQTNGTGGMKLDEGQRGVIGRAYLPVHADPPNTSSTTAVTRVQTAKKRKSLKNLPSRPPAESARAVYPDPCVHLIMPFDVDTSKLPSDYMTTITNTRRDLCAGCKDLNIDCYQSASSTWACLGCELRQEAECSWVTALLAHDPTYGARPPVNTPIQKVNSMFGGFPRHYAGYNQALAGDEDGQMRRTDNTKEADGYSDPTSVIDILLKSHALTSEVIGSYGRTVQDSVNTLTESSKKLSELANVYR